MIVCPTCSNNNPLGTRFCRACGAKLEVKLAQVMGSIETTKKGNRDDAIFNSGRSAVTLAGFLLVCVVVFRALIVPAMPLADLPPPQLGSILPQEIPPPAIVAAPVGDQKRLAWRRDNAGVLVGGLGADVAQLVAAQTAIVATQKPEGTFPGADPLAATALMTLALQAYPKDAAVVTAAAKSRAWLIDQSKDFRGRSPLGRSLALVTLLDADELPESALAESKDSYMVDGKAAVWQAFGLSLFPAKTRPQNPVLVRGALKSDMWSWYFDALAGKNPTVDPKLYFVEQAQLLKTADERLLWAFTAWHFAAAPKDLAQTMSAWSRATPLPVDADTEAKCGPSAAVAVWILTIAAPARVPPLWLAPR